MKILVFTDIHGSHRALKRLRQKAEKSKIDAMACAGDITIFDNNLDLILKDLNSFNVPLYMIHGNHEFEDVFSEMCKLFGNVRFIHEDVFLDEENKVAFVGYGGGGFSMVDKRFEAVIKRLMKKVPRGYKVMLITHAPPYGVKIDRIMEEHCGCKSITNFIRRSKRVDIAISGHLHECEERADRIGRTKVMNPGPFGRIVRL